MTQQMIENFRASYPDSALTDEALRRAIEGGIKVMKRFIVHEGTGLGYELSGEIAVEAAARALAEGFSTTVAPPEYPTVLPLGTLVQFQRGNSPVFDGEITGYWFRLGDELKYRVDYTGPGAQGDNTLAEDEFEVIG